MQETQVWSLDWEDPLEKEEATHSSILAWRIPWTEDPGRLQSMGSQRFRHNWSDWAHTQHLGSPKCHSVQFSSVTQSCPTLCNCMDCSLPGSSVHGIFQARLLEWVAVLFSRGSSQPRDWTQVSCIAGRFFTIWATREAKWNLWLSLLSHLAAVSCESYFMAEIKALEVLGIEPSTLCTLTMCSTKVSLVGHYSAHNIFLANCFTSV